MRRDKNVDKARKATRRKLRVRKAINGTADCPRLSVFRSARHIYTQLLDDDAGRSIAAASSESPEMCAKNMASMGNRKAAYEVGELLAEKAKALGVSKVLFDRGAYLYHGRVRALAEGARKGGLDF